MVNLLHQVESRLVQHIDAKLDSMDSKFTALDTKLAGAQTEIAVFNERMSSVESYVRGVKGTVIATGIAVVGLTVAVLAYGGQWFGIGMDASAVAQQAAERALKTQAEPNRSESNAAK